MIINKSLFTKDNIVKILNYSIMGLTAIQVAIPSLPPLSSDPTKSIYYYKILSAIIIFVVPVLTAWKQATSKYINNKAIWSALFIIFVAAVGGLADFFNHLPFTPSPLTTQWIRTGITGLSLVVNLISRKVAPSELQKLKTLGIDAISTTVTSNIDTVDNTVSVISVTDSNNNSNNNNQKKTS